MFKTMERFRCYVILCLILLLFYCVKSNENCPKMCHCTGNIHVDCSGRNLTGIPDNITLDVENLDLSMNNLTAIPDKAFTKFKKLKELWLAGNKLKDIPSNAFHGLFFLQTLSLQHNDFHQVPPTAFQYLQSLTTLYLDANFIEDIPSEAFKYNQHLKLLQLDANNLKEIPTEALQHLRSLQALDLSVNKLTNIPDYAFSNLTNLAELILHENKISKISDHAFEGLTYLYRLELPMNKIKEIPAAFISLKNLETLSLEDNMIDYIPDKSFIGNKKIHTLKLRPNPIRSFGTKAFTELPLLKELVVSEARDMTVFPDLSGNIELRKLQLDRSSISQIADNFCQMVPSIERLDMHSNKLTRLPILSDCRELKLLNVGENEITSLKEKLFVNNTEMMDLILSHNLISHIDEHTFVGLDNLKYLDLSHNEVTSIDENAFVPLKMLDDLNLSENKFPRLPMKGLHNLQQLKTFHNEELREPIPAKDLPKIKTLVLSYAYHCCDFLHPGEGNEIQFEEKLDWLAPNISANSNLGNLTDFNPFDDMRYNPFNHHYQYRPIDYLSSPVDEDFPPFPDTPDVPDPDAEIVSVTSPIQCEPLPGPFLPCNDLFGWWTLRCGIWIVFMLAIFGNGTVLFVSISGRSTMNVTRFLICNLALADFCMGIYLGILAIVDASTLGEFKTFAIKWQTSAGCLVAGFLGVVSSELSVFTLMMITVERHYAIANAMQFNKKISLRQASIIMTFGWLLCIGLASLPLFDISDYRKFAICLPFDIHNKASLGFVCFIMLFNALSFIIIGGCYIRMYIYIRGSQAWNSKDFRVAKRMAILVVTDFLCWAPIIFFSISAAFGSPLVGLNEAKVLTIFVLPLNSCANPFLYAIFTKQFKRDCVKLCKRIEESSISRSFSNFNSLRLSFGINASCRNSELHSPFHEKRGSSRSNSDSFESSGAGAQNQNGEPLNYDDRKPCSVSERVDQNLELKQKLLTNKKKSFQTNNNNKSSPNKECACQRCRKQSTFSVGPGGTDTEIIIHLDRNGDRVTPDNTSQNSSPESVDDGIDKYDSDKEGPNENDKLLISETEFVDDFEQYNDCDLKKKCEFIPDIKERESNKKGDNKILEKKQHTKSAPFVPCRSNDNILKLPKQPGTKDKTRHINEWRKSSHLSFLWRNSLDLDTGMPKYKSNSLVELARTPQTFDRSPSKRRSLSSRHEGYLLFKNFKRDSAFENEEDMFEYGDDLKNVPSKYLPCESSHHDVDLTDNARLAIKDTFDEQKNLQKVPELSNVKVQDEEDSDCLENETLLPKLQDIDSNLKRDGFDKESGFSSGSQLLNC